MQLPLSRLNARTAGEHLLSLAFVHGQLLFRAVHSVKQAAEDSVQAHVIHEAEEAFTCHAFRG